MPDTPTPTLPTTTSASEALAKAMAAAYGEGIIPPEAKPSPDRRLQDELEAGATGASAVAETGATGATAAAETGATGATAAAETGATGATAAAETGATGATAAAETGATGATAAAETGATGTSLTEAQLDEAQKKMSVGANTAFAAVRRDNKRLEGEIADLKVKLEAASKAPPVTDTEVNSLREENAKFKERLAAVDYQNSEEFQNNIAKPLQAVDTTLAALAAKYNVEVGALTSALAEADAAKRSDKLSELSASFNRLDMQTFDRSINDFDKLNAEKARVLQNAFGIMEKERRDMETARAQAAREVASGWKNSLDVSLKRLVAESPIFAKTEDEAWDKQMSDGIAQVQATDLGRIPVEDIATALYKATAFNMALQLITDLVKKNADQDATITKLRGGTPPVGGGHPPTAPVGPTGPTGGASFLEVAKQKLPSILPN